MKFDTRKSYLYAILATLCWSTVASAFKKTLEYLHGDVVVMLLYSTLVSVLVFLAALLIQRKGHLLFSMNRADIGKSILMGFLNPFLYYLILYKAYFLLPGQEAQPLNYTWPIVLTLLSACFLGQRIRFVHIAAIIFSFIGVLVISTQGHVLSLRFTHIPGALLAVGSSVVWALYWISNMRDERGATLKLLTNFFFGLLYISVAAVILGRVVSISWKGLIGAFWIGLFEMGLTFLLWMKALENAPRTSSVSNIVYLSPFLSLFFLHLVVGERILVSSLVGLVLIVLGILIQTTRETEAKHTT